MIPLESNYEEWLHHHDVSISEHNGIQNINIFEFILQCVDLNYNEVETKGNGKNMVDTTSNFPKVYKE